VEGGNWKKVKDVDANWSYNERYKGLLEQKRKMQSLIETNQWF